MKNKSELTTRQRNLLFAVVKEYCEFGLTVSSKDLKEKYGFTISPATIRNEFASLRELGFLYQPFTNASSQPTEKAFKMFINQILVGVSSTVKQHLQLKHELVEMQKKQETLDKEISRLLALQTGGVGFAVSQSGENISGLKNLLNGESLPEMLDFLERIDQHKGVLLDLDKKAENQELMTIFGSENAVLPLGKGYALVASKAIINNEKTVFGILAQPQILGRKKTLQILNSISQILNEKGEE
jgi:transcriptional regulator of heat shock response